MPIYMNAFLLPSSPSLPFLLEDVYVKGATRVRLDADMDKIHSFARKEGMMAYSVVSSRTKLGADKKTWTPFKRLGKS